MTYQSERDGISIKYPQRFEITEGEPPFDVLFSNLPETKAIRVSLATIQMPYEAYLGSDLSAAFINVGVNEHLSRGECEVLGYKSSNPEGPPRIPKVARIHGVELKGSQTDGVGGGSAYDETDYVTFQNSICDEISEEVVVATRLLGPHLDGLCLPVDYKDVVRRLHTIPSTFRIHGLGARD